MLLSWAYANMRTFYPKIGHFCYQTLRKKILKVPKKLGLNLCLVCRKQLIQPRSAIIQIQWYLLLTHSAQPFRGSYEYDGKRQYSDVLKGLPSFFSYPFPFWEESTCYYYKRLSCDMQLQMCYETNSSPRMLKNLFRSII